MGAIVLLVLLALTVGITTREEKAWPFYALAALLTSFALLGLSALVVGDTPGRASVVLLVAGGLSAACIRAGNSRRAQRPASPGFVTSRQMFPPGTIKGPSRPDEPERW